MALRDLFFGVDFNVNERELRAGDRAMNDLTGETKKAGSSMKKLDKNSKRAGSTLKSIGRTIGAFIGIYELGRGLKYSLQQASDLNEETDKFNTVFGEMRQEAGLWAEEYAERTNASVVETRSAIAENQNLLVGFGATRKEGYRLSTQMQELAGDLSAMNNIEKDLVTNNLQSVMLGQHQAGKSLGLAITEASLQQEALAQGYETTFRNLDPLLKMQLRFDLAMKQSQDSIGKAESEAQTFAGRMRGMKATFRDTAAIAGQQLIPVVGRLLEGFQNNKEAIVGFIVGGVNVAATAFGALTTIVGTSVRIFNTLKPLIIGITAAFAIQKAMIGISALAGAYQTLAGVQMVLGTTTKVGTAIQWAFNEALNANPIGLVAAGIGAAIGALKLLSNHFKWAKDIWDNSIGLIWESIMKMFGLGDTQTSLGLEATAGVNEYATGTNSAKSGLALAGENGPELMNMNGGERVINNSQTKKILSSNNQNVNINININDTDNPIETAKRVENQIDNYFRRARLKGGYA